MVNCAIHTFSFKLWEHGALPLDTNDRGWIFSFPFFLFFFLCGFRTMNHLRYPYSWLLFHLHSFSRLCIALLAFFLLHNHFLLWDKAFLVAQGLSTSIHLPIIKQKHLLPQHVCCFFFFFFFFSLNLFYVAHFKIFMFILVLVL